MSMDNLEVSHARCQYFVCRNVKFIKTNAATSKIYPHHIHNIRGYAKLVVYRRCVNAQDEVCSGMEYIIAFVNDEKITRTEILSFHFVISSHRSWTKFAYVMEGSP